ncbi:chondroitin AC lyase [Hymenobacter sp. UYAg731]
MLFASLRLVALVAFVTCCSISSTWAQQPGAQSEAVDLVRNRCVRLLLSDTAYASEQSYQLSGDIHYAQDGAGYYASLTPEGVWPDIDYQSTLSNAWPPSWHLYRLLLVSRQYHRNHDPQYLAALHRGLAFWISHDFRCPNWWQNQINTPFAYASLLLMLGSEATAPERAFLDDVLRPRIAQAHPTGQNKIWQHDIEARVALLHHDAAGLAQALANMASVVEVTTGEGIQPDYSFQQHGAMLQFGNYGLHFVNSLLFWLAVTEGTSYAFTPQKQRVLFDYCANGLRWTVFRGGMDLTTIGRQWRSGAAGKRGQVLYDDLQLVRALNPAQACRYFLDGFAGPADAACELRGNQSFWRSGYMVQLARSKYSLSVKTHGPFVKKLESINGENQLGAYLNDGVSLVQRTGREYRDIGAYWNWAMLPGTTCDTTQAPGDKLVLQSSNVAAFVGQVSDGLAGLSTMAYDRLGLQARKSYFLVGNTLVALGAGIEASEAKNVVTTVNQCYYKAPLVSAEPTPNSLRWLWHDSIGYFFLANSSQPKTLVRANKSAWPAVDVASPPVPAGGVDVRSTCTILLPHTQTSDYAYALQTGLGQTQARDAARHFPVQVLANTRAVQAIAFNDRVLAAFYQPEKLRMSATLSIAADSPCLLIYKRTTPKPEVWVADPTRTLQSVRLNINGTYRTIALPQGDLLGSTVKMGL